MSDSIALALTKRELSGKKVAKLRADGITPGVMYGHDFAATSVQAPEPLVTKVVKQAGKHHLVELTLDGKKEIGLIKTIDTDPRKNVIRHVAFHVVRQNEKVETDVPIHLIGEGESEAERAGLVVLQSLETLKIRALPKDLPDSLDVSILGLAEAGQGVTISEITIPAGVELVEENLEITIATVYEPSALAAANEAAAGDAEGDVPDSEEDEAEAAGEGEADEKAENTDSEAAPEDKK